MKEINGDLIKMAREGHFDLIIHGANCFCKMRRGIAKQVAEEIPDAVRADNETVSGDIGKLGNYTIGLVYDYNNKPNCRIFNCYTQYHWDSNTRPLDYEALTLCLRKINFNNKGRTIGVPLVGTGLAGGDWDIIQGIIRKELKDMDVTIVRFEK